MDNYGKSTSSAYISDLVMSRTRSGTSSRGKSLWALPQKARFGRALSGAPIQLTTGPLWIHGVLPAKNGKQIFIVGTQPKGELVEFAAGGVEFEFVETEPSG